MSVASKPIWYCIGDFYQRPDTGQSLLLFLPLDPKQRPLGVEVKVDPSRLAFLETVNGVTHLILHDQWKKRHQLTTQNTAFFYEGALHQIDKGVIVGADDAAYNDLLQTRKVYDLILSLLPKQETAPSS